MFEQKFQEIEEAHLRQMKQLIKGYSHSIEDTHVQVGQVRSSSCEILLSCISPRSFHAVFFFHRFLLELCLFKARWESHKSGSGFVVTVDDGGPHTLGVLADVSEVEW